MNGFIAASVAIVRQHDLLLIQRHRPPAEGLWTLPGGRLLPGETPEQCALREIREELGLTLFGLRPLMALSHGRFRLQTFATQAWDGEIVADPAEIRGWGWVEPRRLGHLPTTPQLAEVVEAAFRIFERS